jgi:hypothetical protein
MLVVLLAGASAAEAGGRGVEVQAPSIAACCSSSKTRTVVCSSPRSYTNTHTHTHHHVRVPSLSLAHNDHCSHKKTARRKQKQESSFACSPGASTRVEKRPITSAMSVVFSGRLARSAGESSAAMIPNCSTIDLMFVTWEQASQTADR